MPPVPNVVGGQRVEEAKVELEEGLRQLVEWRNAHAAEVEARRSEVLAQ